MPNGKATIILVLGMHRSGTSAFSRSTIALGATHGDQLLGPREDNPKGFWEDAHIDQLHRDMLEVLGVAWNRLTPLTGKDLENLEKAGFTARAENLLRDKTEKGGVFTLKYPPMAKFYPFWSAVFAAGGFDVRPMLAIRHPLSVARSLVKRDGLDREYACLLFLAHVLPVLSGLRPAISVVSDYDQLMENPDSEVRRIGKHLGLEVDKGILDDYCRGFLSQELRHTKFSLEDLAAQQDLDPLVNEVYTHLLDFASDRKNLADEKTLPMFERWNSEYEAKVPLLGLIERVSADRDRLRILCDNAEKELSWRNASLSWRITRPLRGFRTMIAKSGSSTSTRQTNLSS